MRRFFIEEIDAQAGYCRISGSEAGHITRVLRMGEGDRFILMDRKGARYQVIIDSAGSRDVMVTLEKPLPNPPQSPLKMTLCQALLRSPAMDYVVQKISELGVNEFSPFSSERTVVRLDGQRAVKKRQHWREVAVGAAKQSDRGLPMEIAPLSSFHDLMAGLSRVDALKVIMWEEETTRDLKALLSATSPGKRFIGVVGPEGGFDKEEIQLAGESGFLSVSLGNRVLRAETAAITLAAIVQYEWGDLSFSNTCSSCQ